MTDCDTCKWNYQSYHCYSCSSYDGDLDACDTFCGYCNYHYGDDNCNNCVYYLGD